LKRGKSVRVAEKSETKRDRWRSRGEGRGGKIGRIVKITERRKRGKGEWKDGRTLFLSAEKNGGAGT